MCRALLVATLPLLLIVLSCSETHETVSKDIANPDYYLPQSKTSDPGEFARLYEDLPQDNDSLVDLIKSQLIHPLEVGRYGDAIPEERSYEDTLYTSAEQMLNGLVGYDSLGLTFSRELRNRLVVACFHHSLLFASIVRERGTPVRMRFGFAPYIGEMVGMDVNISHVGCEVWNDDESRWMYIDPDRNMVDFDSADFLTGAEAWQMMRDGSLDMNKTRSAFYNAERAVLDMLRLDLHYALRSEIMYWSEDGPPDVPEFTDLTDADLQILDHIAQLMKHAGGHVDELEILRRDVEFLK